MDVDSANDNHPSHISYVSPVDWLRDVYTRRRKTNPNYSLRAFAKAMQIPPGRISEIFDGKRQLTTSLGLKIADRLGMSPVEVNRFVQLIEQTRTDNRKRNARTEEVAMRQGATVVYDQLTTDAFHLISDWYHYGLLSLIETSDFKSDNRWIARRLGISTIEVKGAIERLYRIGLIEQKGGQINRVAGPLATSTDVPCAALRASHKQSMMQAISALEDVPVEIRDITSTTVAVNLKKLPEAKKLIREFRRGLASLLEEGERDEVYNLNIQLVPVTKVRKKCLEKLS